MCWVILGPSSPADSADGAFLLWDAGVYLLIWVKRLLCPSVRRRSALNTPCSALGGKYSSYKCAHVFVPVLFALWDLNITSSLHHVVWQKWAERREQEERGKLRRERWEHHVKTKWGLSRPWGSLRRMCTARRWRGGDEEDEVWILGRRRRGKMKLSADCEDDVTPACWGDLTLTGSIDYWSHDPDKRPSRDPLGFSAEYQLSVFQKTGILHFISCGLWSVEPWNLPEKPKCCECSSMNAASLAMNLWGGDQARLPAVLHDGCSNHKRVFSLSDMTAGIRLQK